MSQQNALKQHTSDYRRKLLLSILRIAAPVIAIICGISLLLLSFSSRQTALKSQSAAAEKISSDLSHIITNTETLSQDMIFNNEIQQLLTTSTAGEQFPQNANAAYHINGFIANRDYINCVVLTETTRHCILQKKLLPTLQILIRYSSPDGLPSFRIRPVHTCGLLILIFYQ